MNKKLQKLEKKYGTYLYNKGLEIMGEENPTPKALTAAIDEYILSDEFLEVLRKEHEKYSAGKDVFEKLQDIKNIEMKKALIVLLVAILDFKEE